jgi:hypothetical protein
MSFFSQRDLDPLRERNLLQLGSRFKAMGGTYISRNGTRSLSGFGALNSLYLETFSIYMLLFCSCKCLALV